MKVGPINFSQFTGSRQKATEQTVVGGPTRDQNKGQELASEQFATKVFDQESIQEKVKAKQLEEDLSASFSRVSVPFSHQQALTVYSDNEVQGRLEAAQMDISAGIDLLI